MTDDELLAKGLRVMCPLTDWCRAVDALPETGSAVERIIAAVHTERDRRTA